MWPRHTIRHEDKSSVFIVLSYHNINISTKPFRKLECAQRAAVAVAEFQSFCIAAVAVTNVFKPDIYIFVFMRVLCAWKTCTKSSQRQQQQQQQQRRKNENLFTRRHIHQLVCTTAPRTFVSIYLFIHFPSIFFVETKTRSANRREEEVRKRVVVIGRNGEGGEAKGGRWR